MDVKLNWKGKLAFEGAADSGFTQRLDSDLPAGGGISAARPMEFIALGLAGCMGMDVISILVKKKQAVTDFQITAHLEQRQDYPRVFTEAALEFSVYGRDVDEAAVLRAIELSVEKYCPAYIMLDSVFPIRSMYRIYDDESQVLIKEGEYRQAEASA
jgi:putative redox protein